MELNTLISKLQTKQYFESYKTVQIIFIGTKSFNI